TCNAFLEDAQASIKNVYRGTVYSDKSQTSSKTITVRAGDKSMEELKTLADKWINYSSLDWNEFYQSVSVRRIPIPTYPFKKVRRWIEKRTHSIEHNHTVKPATREISNEKQIEKKQFHSSELVQH